MKRLGLSLLCALLLLVGSLPAVDAAPPAAERYLAIYLPGIYFSQIERKLELGNDLTEFLAEKLGDGYRLTPRVYASLEQLDADDAAGRIAIGLIESPLLASRLGTLSPISVAFASSSETRLVVLASASIKTLAGLRGIKLVHSAPLDKPQAFFDNFVFEGEAVMGRDRLTATRDVASALSLISLKKADALLLYEGDEALGQNIGLHALYRTTPLPRPTLVSFDRHLSPADLSRLRDAMAEFSGRQPGLRTFRPTTEAPYQALHTHIVERPKRLPLLIELSDENVAMPLPQKPAGRNAEAPLSVFAPPLDANP